jgi:hypothetical protein
MRAVLLFLGAMVSPFLLAEEQDIVTYDEEVMYLWRSGGIKTLDPEEACRNHDFVKQWLASKPTRYLEYELVGQEPAQVICRVYESTGALYNQQGIYQVQDVFRFCPSASHPIGVDADGDGEIDYCRSHSCSVGSGIIFSSPINSPTGRICGKKEDGSSCEYSSISGSNQNWRPTGEVCSCEEFGAIPCFDTNNSGEPKTEEQGGADDQDPNNDPPECAQSGDIIMCTANPEDHCSSDMSVCESGCGYVNGVFVCFEDPATPTDACSAGDTRPECNGRQEGECPIGVLHCPPIQSGPQDVCVEGDTRIECQGRSAGEVAAINVSLDTGNLEGLLSKIEQNTRRMTEEYTGAHESKIETEYENKKTELDQEYEKLKQTTEEETQLQSNLQKESEAQGWASSLLPSGGTGCNDMAVVTPHGSINYDLCYAASYNRQYLEWFLWVVLVFHSIHTVTRRLVPKE